MLAKFRRSFCLNLGFECEGKNFTEDKKQVMKTRCSEIYRSVGGQVIVVNTALFRVDRFSETSQLMTMTRCE
jgi:hypothetical protein